MKPVAFDYREAREVADASAELATGDTRVLAGGQTLGPLLNLRLARPSALLDVNRIPRLRTVTEHADRIEFGAAVRHAEIEDGLHPDPWHGAMRRVAGGIAYRVVRNRGTLGGSLAHADPAADWVSAMRLGGAVLTLVSSSGERTVPIGQFLKTAYTTALRPGELLLSVSVPKLGSGGVVGYYKLCRKVGEFADAIGAALVDPSARVCRVLAGAVLPTPVLLPVAAATFSASASPVPIASIREELETLAPELDAVRAQHAAVSVHRAMCEVAGA